VEGCARARTRTLVSTLTPRPALPPQQARQVLQAGEGAVVSVREAPRRAGGGHGGAANPANGGGAQAGRALPRRDVLRAQGAPPARPPARIARQLNACEPRRLLSNARACVCECRTCARAAQGELEALVSNRKVRDLKMNDYFGELATINFTGATDQKIESSATVKVVSPSAQVRWGWWQRRRLPGHS
jgi:hypothetical protein